MTCMSVHALNAALATEMMLFYNTISFQFEINSWVYLKNNWTDTRLVCTHLNTYFMKNSNIAMKLENPKRNIKIIGLSSASVTLVE